jgi:hypothetical protein
MRLSILIVCAAIGIPCLAQTDFRQRDHGVEANAFFSQSSGGTRYDGDIHIEIDRKPDPPDTMLLSYTLTVCTGPGVEGCRRESGYGLIPTASATVGKDTVELLIDTSTLSAPFYREGAGGTIRAAWKVDGRREEHTSGSRTVISANSTFHQTGTWSSYSAAATLFLINGSYTVTNAGIAQLNRNSKFTVE